MAPNVTPASEKRMKRRRHGYRGYGSPLRHEHTGTIHWGRGFAGVGFPEGGGILPPRHGLLLEELRESLPAEDGAPEPSD